MGDLDRHSNEHIYMTYQLAQVNIAQLIAPLEDPRIADFVNLLDEINELAEESPGFVWRLKDYNMDPSEPNPFGNPLILINMSVWESVEHLKHYAYHTKHMEVFKRRKEWFHKMDGAHMALWWVSEGHQPTPIEARDKIMELRDHGESESVFTFKSPASPPKT